MNILLVPVGFELTTILRDHSHMASDFQVGRFVGRDVRCFFGIFDLIPTYHYQILYYISKPI